MTLSRISRHEYPRFRALCYVDNVTADPGTGGAVFATDDIAGVHYPISKLAYGALDAVTIVTTGASALPIQDGGNSITVDGTVTAAVGVTATDLGKSEDAVAASGDTGIAVLAVRRDSPVVGSGTDGDYSSLNVDANGRLWASATIDAAIPAGDNNIGNVDIVTVPAPLSTTGGGTEATALRVTIASDSTGTISIDDGGNIITVDGTVDTELTTADLDTGAGTDTRAVVGLVGSASGGGQLIPGSATDGLLVNLGTNNDITGTVTANLGTVGGIATETTAAAILADTTAILADTASIDTGVTSLATTIGTISATAIQRVAIYDNANTQITTFGGGTQYAQDAALAGAGTGTLAMATVDTTLSALTPVDGDADTLRVDANGALWVIPSGTTSVTGTLTAVTNITNTIDSTISGAALTALQLIDDPVVAQGTALGATKNVLMGGSVTTAAPTYTTGQVSPLSLDTSGALRITGAAAGTEYTLGTSTYTEATTLGGIAAVVRSDAGGSLVNTDNEITALQVDSAGALRVTGGGGGTEYSEDIATPATIVGTATMVERDDALSAVTPIEGDWIGLRGTAEGALWTQDFNSDAILADTTAILADTATMDISLTTIAGAVAGTEMQVDVLTMPTVTTNATLAAETTKVIGTVNVAAAQTIGITANSSVNVAQMNGVATTMGNGVSGTGVQRVTIASDSTGSVALTAGGGLTALQLIDNTIVAHDAAVSGSTGVNIIGFEARNAAQTAVSANADAVRGIATLTGKQVTYPYSLPVSTWSYAAASGGIVNTTGVTVKAAAGASTYNYITALQVINGHATVSTDVQLRDGAAGTVIWRGFAQAVGGGISISFPTPLKQPTANTLLEVACGTTGSAVYVNVQGFSSVDV